MLLYDRYRERLFTYCCRMIGDRDRAKDAMQEALLKAYQNAGMYQEGTNVAAWLFRLTRNVCIDMLRARKEHDTIDDLQIPIQEQAPDVMLQDALNLKLNLTVVSELRWRRDEPSPLHIRFEEADVKHVMDPHILRRLSS